MPKVNCLLIITVYEQIVTEITARQASLGASTTSASTSIQRAGSEDSKSEKNFKKVILVMCGITPTGSRVSYWSIICT